MSHAAAAAADPHAHAHAAHDAHESGPPVSSAKFAVWLFLASEVMFFTGLIGAYLVLKVSARPFEVDGGGWQTAFSLSQRHLDKWLAFGNTMVLIASAFTMLTAVAASRIGNLPKLKLNLLLTVVLGLVFVGIKGFEYSSKISHGYLPQTNTFFGMYYTLTGLHVLHMIGGIVPLLVILLRLQLGIKPREQTIELFGLYWSFVDLVWIFLFPLLYLMP